jgi:hypothetical protein
VRFHQSRGDVRFTLEPLKVPPVGREPFWQELEGDAPASVRVVRPMNLSDSASTQQTIEAIVSDLPWGHENHPPRKVITLS